MAAVLWRSVLAGELVLSILVALAVTTLASLHAWTALPIALGAIMLIQYTLVAGSLFTVRALAHENEVPLSALAFARATVLESASFWLVMLAMSAEPWLRGFERSGGSSAPSSRPVLLVHGLACNRGVWRWLLRRLHAAGFARVHALNLDTVRSDLDLLADTVERELLAIHRAYEGARVTIIAHSMGGVIARAVLRTLGPDVIKCVVTLATPHHGSAIARALPLQCTRQICPGSSWLAALNASQEGRSPVPMTSIYTLEDNFVAPARSPMLRGAKVHEMHGLGHFGLLTSRRGLDCVMAALAECA